MYKEIDYKCFMVNIQGATNYKEYVASMVEMQEALFDVLIEIIEVGSLDKAHQHLSEVKGEGKLTEIWVHSLEKLLIRLGVMYDDSKESVLEYLGKLREMNARGTIWYGPPTPVQSIEWVSGVGARIKTKGGKEIGICTEKHSYDLMMSMFESMDTPSLVPLVMQEDGYLMGYLDAGCLLSDMFKGLELKALEYLQNSPVFDCTNMKRLDELVECYDTSWLWRALEDGVYEYHRSIFKARCTQKVVFRIKNYKELEDAILLFDWLKVWDQAEIEVISTSFEDDHVSVGRMVYCESW